jgi:hypothetical protein
MEFRQMFEWSEIVDVLRVLRLECIEQLTAQFGSNPLVQKLALVNETLARLRSR